MSKEPETATTAPTTTTPTTTDETAGTSRWTRWYAAKGAAWNATRNQRRAQDSEYRARVQQTERKARERRLAAIESLQQRVAASRFGVPSALQAASAEVEPGKRRKRLIGLFYSVSNVARFWGRRVRVWQALIASGEVEAPLYQQVHATARGKENDRAVGAPLNALYSEEQLERILKTQPRRLPASIHVLALISEPVYPALAALRYATGLSATALRRLQAQGFIPESPLSFRQAGVDRVSQAYTVKQCEAVARVLLIRYEALLRGASRNNTETQQQAQADACHAAIEREWVALGLMTSV